MKSFEQRMKAMEEMIAEIHAVMVLGKTPAPPGEAEYRRAIEAAAEGDMTLLSAYLRRGGEVLKAETIYGPAAMLRGRSNASRCRTANLPTAATARSMHLSERRKK